MMSLNDETEWEWKMRELEDEEYRRALELSKMTDAPSNTHHRKSHIVNADTNFA